MGHSLRHRPTPTSPRQSRRPTLTELGDSLAEAWTDLDAAEAAGRDRDADATALAIARIEGAIANGEPQTLEEVLLLCRLAFSRLADEDGAARCEILLGRMNSALERLLGIERGRFAGERYLP